LGSAMSESACEEENRTNRCRLSLANFGAQARRPCSYASRS
jgi:hypothetical protein